MVCCNVTCSKLLQLNCFSAVVESWVGWGVMHDDDCVFMVICGSHRMGSRPTSRGYWTLISGNM